MKQTLRSLAGGIMLLGIMLTAEAAAASIAAGKPVRDSTAPAVGEAVTVYTEGEAGYAGFRIPVIIRTGDGTLIAFAEARRHDKRDSGDIDLVMRRSEDDGHTWGPITTVWDDGSNTCGNPAPAILSDGRIVMLATWNRGCDRERQIETTQASIPGAFSCSAPKTTDEPGAIPKRSPPRSRPRSGHGTLPARATPSSSAAHPTKGVSSCRPTTNGWETTDGSNPTRNCSSLMTKVSHGSWEPFHSEAGTKARSPNSQTARCC